MRIKQKIPFLKNDYLNYKDWLIKENQHYIFHFLEDSLVKNEINEITQIQEEAYDRIIKTLGLRNRIKISYYLYPSKKIKEELMGSSDYGNAIWQEIIRKNNCWQARKHEVHCIYNNKDKVIGAHEDTHLLTLPWGVAIYFFCEGLAEFMSDNWHGKDIDIWTRDYLRKGCLYSIRFLFDNKNWDRIDDMIVYPQAGSFIRFLIEEYGLEKFKEAYKDLLRRNGTKRNISIIEKRYSLPLEKLEEKWRKSV